MSNGQDEGRDSVSDIMQPDEGTASTGPAASAPVESGGPPPGSAGSGGTGSSRRRLSPLVLAAVALVVALVIGAVVLLGGDDSPEVEALGMEVANVTQALAQAEAQLQEVAAMQPAASVAPDARCWYSYPAGESEPNPFLRCGPVYFLDSDESAFWLNVPVDFTVASDAAAAVVGELMDIEPLTEALAEDEELIRPDGGEPPEPEEVDIERPPPPEAEAGTLEVSNDAATVELTEQPEMDG